LSRVLPLVKRIEELYVERNKLLVENGLEDFVFSDKEIEKHIIEALEKEVVDKINQAVEKL